MHSRVYALWTQSEDLSVFLAFTRNGLRLEGHTPVMYNFSEVSLILYDTASAYRNRAGGEEAEGVESGEERPSHSNQRPSRPQCALPPITLALSRWRPR